MPDGTLNKRYVRTLTLAPDPVDVFALGQIREQFTCGCERCRLLLPSGLETDTVHSTLECQRFPTEDAQSFPEELQHDP